MNPRLAYLVMAHQHPEQLERLLRVISAEGNVYVIHVDKRAPSAVHDVAAKLAANNANVHVLKSRVCRWGGWSLVAVELDAIRWLTQHDADWDWFLNISGQDFPLQSQEQIAAELGAQNTNFVQHYPGDAVPGGWGNPYFPAGSPDHDDSWSRVRYVYVEVPGLDGIRRVPKLRRRFPSGVRWFGGSQWMVLTREACEYALRDPKARRLQRFFRFTFIPDETYFPTVLANAPFAETLVNDNKRAIVFDPGIKTFTAADYDFLVSQPKFFARKFDTEVDGEILDRLEARLG